MVDHTKEIFNLACKVHQLKEWVAWEFAKLSSRGSLLHLGQSTGYKMLASRCLDHFTVYYTILRSNEESTEAKEKAIKELLNQVSEAWLQTNMALFKHVLDYEAKLDALLDRAGGWIRAQKECIWTMMVQITEDTGVPLCAGLTIVFHLLDTLPSFPAHLAYQSTSTIITGFTPRVYAQQPWLGLHSQDLVHTPPPDSCRKAEDV